jgi:hypothetical protein
MSGLADLILNINRMLSINQSRMRHVYGPGDYMMVDQVLHKERSEISFDIKTEQLIVPEISGYMMDVHNDHLELIGEDQRVVLSAPIAFGPIDTSANLNMPDDLDMFNINVNKLLKINAFASLFSVHGIKESDIKDCLITIKENPNPSYDWSADDKLVEDGYVDFEMDEIGDIMNRAFENQSEESKDSEETSDESDDDLELNEQTQKMLELVELDTEHYNPYRPRQRSDKRGAIIYERIKSLQYLMIAYILCGRTFNATTQIIRTAERMRLRQIAIDALNYVHNLRMSHTDVVIQNASLTVPEWLLDSLGQD